MLLKDGLVHPSWTGDFNKSSQWFDLALIQFSGGLPAGYKPATWLSDAADLKIGAKVTVAGFGATGTKITHTNAAYYKNWIDENIKSLKVSVNE